MNVVDSSGWLEYFIDGPNAHFFSFAIENIPALIVPTISIFEVFKKVLRERDENAALRVVAIMRQGRVIDLDFNLSLSAAKISSSKQLPMADSIMLATAWEHGATLWTQDVDFKDITGVEYIAKSQ